MQTRSPRVVGRDPEIDHLHRLLASARGGHGGAVFLVGTAREWHRLIVGHGLTISTNLFGSTFYALIGLHASHVSLGIIVLALLSVFGFTGALRREDMARAELAAWYWHFVDGVWIVVFTVVYVVGR